MSHVSPAPRRPFEVRGWHVLAGISAFFAIVAAVDGAFMVLAIRTFPGQVSVTPYEDGLLYNHRIAQLETQARLGWRAAAGAEPGQVAMSFRDVAGNPVVGLSIAGRLERPATQTGRVALRFVETAPGLYVAPAGRITGAWDLTAEARSVRGATFVAERRLTWS